ncbi:MAG TPA: Clp protease N-terminal domain-containing protein [Vicinamibacterales bacterium]|nr:Clp protease N-terminal domain-containing protein [Vicinamibacterales bacterium]
MSSELPARPSLEYLKKLAKERLHELQQQNPSAKLADVQHAIAREYGFLNWTQLKESVTSSPVPPAVPPASPYPGLFARFTTRAKRATFFSRFEAGGFGHPSIDPEHLMIGVIRARDGLSSRILSDARLSPDHLRKDVSERRSAGEPIGFTVMIEFSGATKHVIQIAAAEADRLQHHDIGTVHLLLGLLQDEKSLASSILRENGLRLDEVRGHAGDLLDDDAKT